MQNNLPSSKVAPGELNAYMQHAAQKAQAAPVKTIHAYRVRVQDTWSGGIETVLVYCRTFEEISGTLGVDGVDWKIVDAAQLPEKWYVVSRNVNGHMTPVCCVYAFSAARAGSIYRISQHAVLRETIAVRELEYIGGNEVTK